MRIRPKKTIYLTIKNQLKVKFLKNLNYHKEVSKFWICNAYNYIFKISQSQMNSHDIRSVYQMNDIEDEWATIVKFDTELFKKEKELEQLRQIE